MRRLTRIALCAACAAGIGFGILSPLGQKRAAADDSMMMQKKDIIDTAVGPGMQEVTTVVTAIKAADLVDTLKGKGPFTVFAPTNAAFDKLPKGTVDDLLKPENKEKLKNILLYHVHVGDAIMAKDVKTMKLSTAEGKDLDVKVQDGGVWVNDAKVVKTDVVCSNGVIHWIDTVVMPPEK
jgi:transforming growth factor-beta-induced protein